MMTSSLNQHKTSLKISIVTFPHGISEQLSGPIRQDFVADISCEKNIRRSKWSWNRNVASDVDHASVSRESQDAGRFGDNIRDPWLRCQQDKFFKFYKDLKNV